MPRQSILNTIDKAQNTIPKRGRIISYNTKTKSVIYSCDNCLKENEIMLQTLLKNNPNQKAICLCSPEIRYIDIPNTKIQDEQYIEYVYDIETSTHHFAAGVGDMIVHNSIYGCLGANGLLLLLEGAETVTAMGRKLIMMAIEKICKKYPETRLVYGDTDSCMFTFENRTLEETFVLARECSRMVTHYLKCHIINVPEDYTIGLNHIPISKITSTNSNFKSFTYKEQCNILDYESCPIDLEFEKMYGKYFLLTKKRYVAHDVNEKGEITGTTKKGMCEIKRNYCRYVQNTSKLITDAILEEKSEKFVMNILYDRINILFTRATTTTIINGQKIVVRQIPDTHLIINAGINSLISYATTKEVKTQEKIIKVFIDKYGDVIDYPIGPLDPRLVYKNLPHVLLALKMTQRGEDIPPNSRLEIIYLEKQNTKHQGEKAEDYTYYKEKKDIENLKPCYLHYIEKQLLIPMTELITVMYPKPELPNISLEDKLYDILNSGEFGYTLNELHKYNVSQIKVFEKDKPKPIKFKNLIGWEEYDNLDSKYKHLFKRISNKNNCKFKNNIYKNNDAKISYMLNELKYEDDRDNLNAISKKKYPDLINLCHLWKSILIIDKIRRQHGINKYKWKNPILRKDVIGIHKKVLFIRGKYKDKHGIILKRTKEGKGKFITYYYDIILDKFDIFYKSDITDVIIEKVSRKDFAQLIAKDGTIMDDILYYRSCYKEVVKSLNELF